MNSFHFIVDFNSINFVFFYKYWNGNTFRLNETKTFNHSSLLKKKKYRVIWTLEPCSRVCACVSVNELWLRINVLQFVFSQPVEFCRKILCSFLRRALKFAILICITFSSSVFSDWYYCITDCVRYDFHDKNTKIDLRDWIVTCYQLEVLMLQQAKILNFHFCNTFWLKNIISQVKD